MSGLYEKAIVEHAKHPQGRGSLPGADREASGANPLCGDELTLRARVANGRIQEIAFEGEGCAICIGSASMMIGATRGHAEDDAREMMRRVRALVCGQGDAANLGELAALGGVTRFAARHDCALLPWNTLEAVLDARLK